MKKKVLKILIMGLIFVAFIQLNVLATSVTMEVKANRENYNVNETITATIDCNMEMQATDFKLQYDATKLSLTGASIEDTFYTIEKDEEKENCNIITVSWLSVAEKVEDEVKLTNISFTFKALQKGETQIKIVDVESMADENLVIPDEIDYTTKGTKTVNVSMLGDVNLDGAIDGEDLIELNRYIVGYQEIEGEKLTNSDVNIDGVVDKYDEEILRMYLTKEITQLPIIYGDIDKNGIASGKDLGLLRHYINGDEDVKEKYMTVEGLIRSDLNLDGLINNSDITILRSFIAGNPNVTLPIKLIANNKIQNTVLDNIAIISGFENTNMKVTNFLENFNKNYSAKVYDFNNNELSNDKNIGTGTIIRFNEQVVEEEKVCYGEYHVIIYGDTDGDGDINAVDALGIIKNKLELLKFSNEIFEEAGRVTKDSRKNKSIPNAVDALAIVKHKLELDQIKQVID